MRERGTFAVPPTPTPGQSAAAPNGDWLDFGGSSFDQRYSLLTDVTPSNAAKLDVAWHIHLGESAVSQTSGGVEYGGVYYIASGNNDIFALDATTGAQIWKWTANTNYSNHFAGLRAVRGIAIAAGRVYTALGDNTVTALDAATGGVVWQKQIADTALGYYMTGAPEYFNNEVIVGVGGGENGIRGFVQALNATTGASVWKSYTIPAAGTKAAKTWGDPKSLATGGAPVWTHPVVDPALGYVFVGTGNAAPYANRAPGMDLWTSSDVALNAKTGKMVWYYQTVHHDMWDDDIATSPVLYDVKVGKQTRHVLDQPTKMGLNFMLDRKTGKPVIPTPEVPQPQSKEQNTWPTQPVPYGEPYAPQCSTPQEWVAAGGSPTLLGPDGVPLVFGCNYTPISTQHYTVPGWHDTSDWPPAAFDQATNAVYVCSTNNRGDGYEAIPVANFHPTVGANYTSNVSKLAGDWIKQKVGVVTAIDARTNAVLWKRILPDGNGCYSGLATTAGGLVFVGTLDHHLLAYDASTGDLDWTSPLLDASVNAPPIVYRGPDGREYVTVLVGGDTISLASNIGDSVYSFAIPK